uniref:AP-2 complex subunit alpha n=1 Tax=Trypanosoma grayi TaxID=71804 RepID=M4T100_9TRYP|nr:AP-2 complex subunit alpha [Trypanosoma grayi]
MDMRGLAHFIQDVRKATSSPAEERRRVDLELVKIRSKFRDTAKMSTYDRKKYVCKLMFIAMLGYPVEFGHMEGINLLSLTSPAEKLIGYLSVAVFLHENHPLLILATHMIYKDLLSEQEFNMSLALTAIANTGGKDFAEVMSLGVKTILMSDRWDVHIRKKAVLTYLRIYRKYPDFADLMEVVPVVIGLVLSPLFGMSGCAVVFLTGCLNKTNIHLFQLIPCKIIELLEKIILGKQTEPGYVYYGVPAPWLQAMSIRLLRKFPAPVDSQLKEKALRVLRSIVQATDRVLRDAQTQQKQKGTMNRVSAMNAVLFEVVLLVLEWDVDTKLRTECLDLLASFAAEKKESNLRYLGFSLLSRVCAPRGSRNEYRLYCRQYQPQIIVALHDPDISIRTKALDVTVNMCDAESASEVIGDLLSYLPITDGAFKESIVLAIAHLAEKYCTDYGWYVDTVISIIAQAGNLVPQELVYRVVHVIINHSYVQKRAAMSLFSTLMNRKTVPDVLLRVASIVLGEFGYQIALNPESTPLMQVTVLQNHLNDASEEAQSLVLSAFVKLYNYYDGLVREKILKALRAYRTNFNVELQQRAMEYVGLIELGNDDLLQKVLEPLPFFEGDTFATVLDGPSQAVVGLVPQSAGTQNRRSSQDASTTKQPSNQTILTGLLEMNHDVSLKSGWTKDTVMEALFEVSSAVQLERITRESEAVHQLFLSLLTKPNGILYSDETVELYCEQQYRGADARLTLTVRAKAAAVLRNVLLEIVGADAGLLLQSRHNHGDIPTGGALRVDFVARSWAPYQQAPTIRLFHEGFGEFAPTMKVLSLPITTTRFLAPYDNDDDDDEGGVAYDTLCSQLSTASFTMRHIDAGFSLHKGVLERVLTSMGFRTVRVASSREIKAIAAHATQSHGTLSFSPVVVDIIVSSDGGAATKVLSQSPVLHSAVADVLEQLLLGLGKNTVENGVHDGGDALSTRTEDFFLS